jgi:LacI family repressor for deo operon, udp, cdd, tsx, nupC, and nupG
MKTVRSAGVRVPEDVSLIGFDGTEIADYVEPALTTFRQPLYEVGRMGAEVLLGIIAGTVAQDHSLFRMPVTFLGRGTAGAAPDLAMERHGDEARG